MQKKTLEKFQKVIEKIVWRHVNANEVLDANVRIAKLSQ